LQEERRHAIAVESQALGEIVRRDHRPPADGAVALLRDDTLDRLLGNRPADEGPGSVLVLGAGRDAEAVRVGAGVVAGWPHGHQGIAGGLGNLALLVRDQRRYPG